jgi:DNA-binding transcriptional regulator YhcF (GntR family)
VSPFRLSIQPGQSIFDQVVFAAIRSFVNRQLLPGEQFPSVRGLAADLKIHPNTALRIVQHLIQERWLEVRPGIGTVVAQRPTPREGDKERLLDHELEQLIVGAKRVGLNLGDLQSAIAARWLHGEGRMSNDGDRNDGSLPALQPE